MGSRPRKGKYYTNIRRYGGTFKNRKIVQYPPRALLSTTVLHRPLGFERHLFRFLYYLLTFKEHDKDFDQNLDYFSSILKSYICILYSKTSCGVMYLG